MHVLTVFWCVLRWSHDCVNFTVKHSLTSFSFCLSSSFRPWSALKPFIGSDRTDLTWKQKKNQTLKEKGAGNNFKEESRHFQDLILEPITWPCILILIVLPITLNIISDHVRYFSVYQFLCNEQLQFTLQFLQCKTANCAHVISWNNHYYRCALCLRIVAEVNQLVVVG